MIDAQRCTIAWQYTEVRGSNVHEIVARIEQVIVERNVLGGGIPQADRRARGTGTKDKLVVSRSQSLRGKEHLRSVASQRRRWLLGHVIDELKGRARQEKNQQDDKDNDESKENPPHR